MTLPDAKLSARLVPNWDPPRMAKNFSQIQRRIGQQSRHRRVVWSVAALAASVALLWFGFGLWPAQTDRYASTTHETSPSAQTRFSDGSTATALTPGAVLEVKKTSDSEIVIATKAGSHRFDVVPNSARQFVVQAADVRVRVLGTEFVVDRVNERAQVRVLRGRVEVAWPSGRTELGVGESGWFPPASESPTPAAASSVGEVAKSVAEPSKSVAAANPHTRFVELSRQGNYQAAFSIVDRTPSLFERSAEDLMMAADAARLSNHPAQAVPYLQRITKEYARDSRAPLAAFTLGRIYMSQLGQPAAAASAFALVRQLAPNGALAEDSLAREAEARERAGQHAAARRVAEEYLRQYPTGRSSERLQHLLPASGSSAGSAEAPRSASESLH